VKKTLFLLAIAAIIFSSCKKEHGLSTKISSVKKYAVHIQVANFTVSHANFTLRTKASHLASSSDTLTNLASYIDLLYYVVMDQNTWRVIKIITQDSTMANMGMINDSLPTGNYTIGVIAGKNGLKIGQVISPAPAPTYGYDCQPWQDTFFTLTGIAVNAQNYYQTLTLTRVVGKLELTLLDNIPANADSLFVSFYGAGPASFTGGAFGVNNTYRFAIPAPAKGRPNFTLDMLIFTNAYGYIGSADPGQQFTITCKAAGGNVLGTATANSVIINPNQKTILSGNLFNDSPTQSFTAVVDTAWSSGITRVGFSLKRH
jgi:hypothetical protein